MPNVPAISLPTAGAFGYVPTADPQQDSATHALIGGGGGGANVLDAYIVATTGGPNNNPNDIPFAAVNGYGTLAARPGSSTEGYIYFANDTGQFYRWTSGIWQSVTPVASDPTKLAIANNLTDVANRQTSLNNLAGGTTNHQVLAGNGTNITLRALTGTDIPPVLTPTAIKTSAYPAVAGDLVLCDVSAGNFTVTLPSAPADGTTIGVEVVNTAAGRYVTVQRGGTDLFDDVLLLDRKFITALANMAVFQYQASTTQWFTQGPDGPDVFWSGGIFSAVASIAGAASLIGGPITMGNILAGSPYDQAGDLLHMHAQGIMSNTSGASSTVNVNLALAGNTDQLMTGTTMATGSTAHWNIEVWAYTASSIFGITLYPISCSCLWSPTTNKIVLADTAITPNSLAGMWATQFASPTFDVIGSSSVNNALMSMQCYGAAITRYRS